MLVERCFCCLDPFGHLVLPHFRVVPSAMCLSLYCMATTISPVSQSGCCLRLTFLCFTCPCVSHKPPKHIHASNASSTSVGLEISEYGIWWRSCTKWFVSKCFYCWYVIAKGIAVFVELCLHNITIGDHAGSNVLPVCLVEIINQGITSCSYTGRWCDDLC